MKKTLYKTAKRTLRTYNANFQCEDCSKYCYNVDVGMKTMIANLNRDS
jgi:hypothetical protein